MDDAVWDRSTFSANRDRLLNERMSRLFFERVLLLAEWRAFVSDEHFLVDGTLIQAYPRAQVAIDEKLCQQGWRSPPPPEDKSRNPSVNFKDGNRSTNPDEP